MKRKAILFGYLATNKMMYNGQTIRTRSVKRVLEESMGYDIESYDTLQLRRNLFSIFPYLFKIKNNNQVFVLLAHRGVRFLLPIIVLFSKLFKKKVYFIAIGGWLPIFLEKYKLLQYAVNNTSINFVQSSMMADAITAICPDSINKVLPNFKFHSFYKDRNSRDCNSNRQAFKIIFISQVSRVKGIDTVKALADKIEDADLAISIDVYGPIKDNEKLYIEKLLKGSNKVKYCGILKSDEIFCRLSDYDLMLFPTHHMTEGFPGVILDAFIVGLPIIASNWNYSKEFIKKDFGFIFDHNRPLEAFKYIKILYDNPSLLNKMKLASYENRKKYEISSIVEILRNNGL